MSTLQIALYDTFESTTQLLISDVFMRYNYFGHVTLDSAQEAANCKLQTGSDNLAALYCPLSLH